MVLNLLLSILDKAYENGKKTKYVQYINTCIPTSIKNIEVKFIDKYAK